MTTDEGSPKVNPKITKRRVFITTALGIIILTIIFFAKLWYTGSVRLGPLHINGWTPLQSSEMFFHVGGLNRNLAFEKFLSMGKVTPALNNNSSGKPSPTPVKPREDSESYIDFEFTVPKGWKYSSYQGSEQISTGNPSCTCGNYECYIDYEVCKQDEVNDYAQITVSSADFCERYKDSFEKLNLPKKCESFTRSDFIEYKDTFFRDTYTAHKDSGADCGPFGVYGKPEVTKVAGYYAIVQEQGESCGFPTSGSYFKTYSILLSDKPSPKLVEITFRSWGVVAKHSVNFQNVVNSFKITGPERMYMDKFTKQDVAVLMKLLKFQVLPDALTVLNDPVTLYVGQDRKSTTFDAVKINQKIDSPDLTWLESAARILKSKGFTKVEDVTSTTDSREFENENAYCLTRQFAGEATIWCGLLE